MEESHELRTKAHGYYTDPETGDVVIQEIPGYELAGKQDIIVNDKKLAEITDTAIPINEAAKVYNKPKEKSSAELLAEAKSLLKKEPNTIPVQTEQQKEFEKHVEKWRKYYADNRGKIPSDIPKTIFDNDLNKEPKTNVNQIRRFNRLIKDGF
jgi:hypothetical protein